MPSEPRLTAREREIALAIVAAYMAPAGWSQDAIDDWQMDIDRAEAVVPLTDRGAYVQAVAHRLVDLLETQAERTGRGRRHG